MEMPSADVLQWVIVIETTLILLLCVIGLRR
jgi:hypothetical protein